MDISVIIPTYNEQTNIEHTLLDILSYFSEKQLCYEIIVVDDGSTDNTVNIVNSLKQKFQSIRSIISTPNRGKGFVVRKGVMEAQGDIILFMDADNATNIRELEKFLPQFDKGQEFVIASRRMRNGDVDVTFSQARRIFGKIYIFLSQWLVVSGVTDYNCGFKAFRHLVAKQLFSKQLMNDWSFDTEVIFLASKYGIPIKEIPVNWSHRNGTSKVNPVLDGLKSFLSLLEIRKNDFMGKYT